MIRSPVSNPMLQALNSIRRDLNGHKLQPSPDPPSLTSQPWNRLTVSHSTLQPPSGQPVGVNPSNLSDLLRSQINLPQSVELDLRIIRVSVWNLSGTSVGLRTYDLLREVGIGTNPLAVQLDRPGRNRWAKTGYYWAATQRNNTLVSTDSDTRLFDLEADKESATLVFQVELLWRPRPDKSVPTSFYL